jgi:hypothetical protein
VSFQRIKTWKASKDSRYREKKARVEHLYAVADRETAPDGLRTGVVHLTRAEPAATALQARSPMTALRRRSRRAASQ